MPLTPSISVSQSSLAPNLITVTDTSTGSDASIAARRISFQTPQGTYLVETGTSTTYEIWPYADSSDTFNVLRKDYALSITVLWVDADGDTLYTYTQVYPFAQYNKQFAVQLGDLQALAPRTTMNSNYAYNMAIYWMNIVYGENMVSIAADISNAQNFFDQATEMRENQSIYFG